MIFGHFLLFFIFLFICALTIHKCQIVMRAILSFFDFWTIFVVFYFSFHFCYDLPQVSNCYADWGLITAAGEAYDSGRGG